jgi:putative tryptophan/tyrosine transport system substrate-binding protein
MQRRNFITLLGGAAATWPLAARAQQPEQIRRIGYLGSDSASKTVVRVDALRTGLHDLGFVEGKNIVIELRWAEGNYDRLPDLVAELIGLKIEVLVTQGTPVTVAAKRMTRTVPIVMVPVGDAVESGIIDSLARPGGNITGITFFLPQLCSKRLELLKQMIPGIGRVAVLVNPDNPAAPPTLRAMEVAAKSLELELDQFEARAPSEFDGAFSMMSKKDVDAVVIVDDGVLIAHAGLIADLAKEKRVPSAGFKEFADVGGMIAYGPSRFEMYHRAAYFIDKILKGSKPADLPVERPTKFELTINLKTTKTLGITVPSTLLATADEVIE